MNRQAFLAAALVLVLLPGCHRTTHITREDQLTHVTTASEKTAETSADTTVLPADTTVLPADTTSVETTAAETTAVETTAAEENTEAQQTKPSSTKATKPPSTKATKPPETTAPETAAETEATLPATESTEPVAAKPDPYDISGYTCGSLEYGIADAINARRREAGLPELSLGRKLSGIGSVRAYESSLTFSHTRPDGRNWSSVLGDYGYGCGHAGENLLQSSDGYSAADMVELWMGSAGHRANILDPEVTHLGVGVYRSGGMVYVATIFTD